MSSYTADIFAILGAEMPPGRDSYVRAWSSTRASIRILSTGEDRITVTGELSPAAVERTLVQLSLLRLERLDHFALKGADVHGGGRSLWLEFTHTTEPGRKLDRARRGDSKRHLPAYAPRFVALFSHRNLSTAARREDPITISMDDAAIDTLAAGLSDMLLSGFGVDHVDMEIPVEPADDVTVTLLDLTLRCVANEQR